MKISQANRLRILYFLVFCCTASWLPIFAEYLKDQGISGFQTAAILSILPVLMFLIQPFYGGLADRLGFKKCLLWSSLCCAITYLLYYFNGQTFLTLSIVTACMALFYNSIQPLLDSLSLELSEKNPSFSYGSLRIAGAAGWSFMGLVVGQSIDMSDTSVIFAFSAASMFLTFLFCFGLDTNMRHAKTSREKKRIPKEVVTDRNLLLVLFLVVLVSMSATPIWYYYSLYMKEMGASSVTVGVGLSFQGLCELPFFYFSAKIIQRLGFKGTLLLTIGATIIRLFLYSFIKNPYLAIPIELLHGLSWSLFWVVCVEYTNALVPENWRATGQSLLYAAYFGVGTIMGNFLVGSFQDSKYTISKIFAISGILVVVAFVIAWLFLKDKNKEEIVHLQTTQNQ
ncbi:MFS transporter [Flavobacterium sp. XS2P39]|uniref:MFS transporter n=1 Tax=Flavobacterium sp. XS2P39 TaxID=3401725 RepID=UPI003AAD4454